MYNLFNKVRSKIIFVKFFFSLVTVTSIFVIIIVSFMYYWFRNNTMDSINDTNKLVLSNINTMMSNYLDSASRIALEIYQDHTIQKLRYSNENEIDYYQINNVSLRLNNVLAANQSISSIYVYRNNDLILSKANDNLDNSTDNELLKLLKTTKVLYPSAIKVKSIMRQDINMIMVTYMENKHGDTFFNGAVIVAINADKLQKSMLTSINDKEQKTIVLGKSGNIILSSDMSDFGRNISKQIYVDKILHSNSNHGMLEIQLEGKRNSVNYIKSEDGNHYVMMLTDYKAKIQKITDIRNILIVVSIIILLCTIIVSLIIANRIYQPIGNVFSRLKNMFGEFQPDLANANELQLISQMTTNFIERMNNMEKENENLEFRKLILSNDYLYKEALLSKFTGFKSLYEQEIRYFVIVMRIDDFKSYSKNNVSQAMDFQINSLGSISYEFFNGKALCSYFVMDYNHAVLVVVEDKKGNKKNDITVEDILKDVQNAVYKILGLRVTIGISAASEDVAEIRERYHEAFDLTNYRIIVGKQSIINKNIVDEMAQDNMFFSHYTNKVLDAVKNMNKEAFGETLDMIFSNCKRLKYDCIIKTLTELAVSMYKITEDLVKETKSQVLSEYIEIHRQITGMEDFDEIKDWFLTQYIEIEDSLFGLKNSKINSIISNSIKYIDDNFKRSDISANSIAEMLSITPSYFSRMFKEHVGMCFPEYINNVRLQRAKELLVGMPDMVITEICAQTGYNSTTYFTSSFSKKYGISPSKYRMSKLLSK